MKIANLFALVAASISATAFAEVNWWAVPAMSGVQRLPNVIPADGVKGGTVKLSAARGEYEPASFVVRSDASLGKVKLEVSDLKQVEGGRLKVGGAVFPKENLDLRVVKVWYQNKNGWFSYFADTGFKLCPELLLHDEDLIRVDTEKEANYARLTAKDGKTTEWWLNPPRLLNGRYFDHFSETTAFPSMRPDFVDAKTLQPVTLDKDVSKQFILTAHVLPNTPAGVYEGKITLSTVQPSTSNLQPLTIPLTLKVLDFDLPKPMAYLHPEMDFRICSYDYLNLGEILSFNGGDEELMWKQLEAILANLVAHGQDMKWIKAGTATPEAERMIATMKKVGMRTDTIVGGVDFKWGEDNYDASYGRATRIRDYYDRFLGHHDLYACYGDEPGAKFFAKSRKIFDAYQAAGFKFIIASHEHIFDMAGYRWNWHNASKKPTDPSAAMTWSQMGTDTYSAWYADQHVGAENPEFNRRQNGLGAYLSGYTAFCNYAHHLGPYNDDSETYKPMVFVYGTGDGCIDTLQWEGFREGVDDIRYATLMTALAREAEKSGDIKVRYLGGKAKVLLARFDRKAGDLNAVRGEMIRFIEELRAALGEKADVKIVAQKKPALKVEPTVREPLPTDPKALPAYYAKYYMIDEQIAAFKQIGQKVEAAKVMHGRSTERTQEALALAEEALKEGLAANDKGAFGKAWKFLLDTNPATADKYSDDAVRLLGAAAAADAWVNNASGMLVARNGNWARVRRAYDLARQADGANTNRLWSLKVVRYAIPAYLEIGDAKSVAEFCDYGLTTAAKGDKRCAYKPEDVYFLQLAKSICGAKDAAEVAAKLAAADKQFGEGVAPAKRKDSLEKLGSFAMCANREAMVRGVAAFLDKVFAPKLDKAYTVRYSPTRILGLGSWEAAAASVKPGTEKLDRAYGGDASCLWTDVATSRGSVDADANKTYARAPEWQAMADDWGLHFRLEIFDEKAKDIALGLASAGTLESYLAPGENTPYHAFLHSFEPGGLSVYNGVYDGPDHREIDAKDRVNCHEEILTTKDSVVLYMAFSWNVYATRVPTAESVWDFEPMLWGRKTSCSWNGLKTIHGRSSWGHLKFALTDAERRQILRPVLAAARKEYEALKRPTGAVALWQNEEVGDPAFYENVLKPVVEKLDAAAARVTSEMDDATVDELAQTALPSWHNFKFEVQRLRAEYLQR